MKEQKAENDALVAFLSNPNAQIEDYIKHNITSDNTQLLSKDEYKNTPFIKKTFSKDGVFNEAEFDKLYDLASEKYYELVDEKSFHNFLKYNPNSRYKPLGAKTIDTNFSPLKGANPTRVSKSISGLNVEGEQLKTEEELAQMGKIWDSENGKWKEGTAESQSFASKAFGKTLVYALYDHDGYQINPVTGEYKYHRQGEWMTDEDGNYFTMTVSKEDIGNKKVVSLSDILTKEDSVINKLDFFDSDGFNKSIGGIAMKTMVAIAPYLIPGFNKWYGGMAAAIGLASVMPTFFKAMDSLVSGGDNQAYTTATQLENWFRKFNTTGKSRKGQESFFTIESVGDLLADVFGQLHQQQAAFGLAKYFKKIPEIKGATTVDDIIKASRAQLNLGKALSLGYMGLISTSDVYNDAIQAGYDKRVAGMTALASAGALFGIMNFNESANGLGTWFLKKTTGYDHDLMRSPLIRIAKTEYKQAEKALNEYLKTGNPSEVNKFFGNFWANAKDKMQDIFVAGNIDSWQGLEGVWKSMIVEGVEEVTEEVVQDSVKGVVDALSSLGFLSQQGSFGGWSNVFSKEGASRYLQTLLGGALGGAVFDIQMNNIDPWMQKTFKDPNYRSPRELQAEHDIIDVIFEGRTNELIDEVRHLSKRIFNTKKGATSYIDSDGNEKTILQDGQKSQADAIAEETIRRILELDTLVKGSLGIKDFGSISAALQNALKVAYGDNFKSEKLKTYQQNIFKDSLKHMSDYYKMWQDAEKALKETKESENVDQEKAKYEIEVLKKSFEYWRDKCKGFFNGEEAIHTLQQMNLILLLDENLANLTVLDKDTWYKLHYSRPYESLVEGSETDPIWIESKKGVDAAYEAYRKSATDVDTLTQSMPILEQTYLAMQRTIKPEILKWIKSKKKEQYLKSLGFDYGDVFLDALDAIDLNGTGVDKLQLLIALQEGAIGKIAKYAQADPLAFTLDDFLNIKLAEELESKKIIDLSEYSEGQQKLIRSMINWNAAVSRNSVFNKDTIKSIISKTNEQLNDSTNIYTRALQLLSELEEGENAVIDTTKTQQIKFNLGAITEDIEGIKAEKISEVIGEDSEISPDMFRMIVNFTAHQIAKAILESSVADKMLISFPDFYKEIKSTLTIPVKNENFLQRPAIDVASEILDAAFLDDSESTDLLLPAITQIVEMAQLQFGNKTILDVNPLLEAIEKLHFSLGNNGKNSKGLFNWLFSKETELQASDFTGDTFELTELERTGVKDAKNTLKVLNAALLGTFIGGKEEIIPGTEFTVQPLGINSIQVQYLDSYHDGKGREEYLILDEDDYKAVSNYIGQLSEKLRTVEQIDSELFKTKSQYYDGLRQAKTKGLKTLFLQGVLKSFKLDLPDQPEIDLLEGFVPDSNWSEEFYVEQARTVVTKNIRKAYNNLSSIPEGEDKEETFYKAIYKGIESILTEAGLPIESLFEDAVQSWNAVQDADGKLAKLNGAYLAKELIRSLYIDPKSEQDLLKSIYEENPTISPRVDQEEALINIDFILKHTNSVKKLAKVAHNLQEEHEGLNLIRKTFLDNVYFLLGSGGSGKTLLMSLLAKHYPDKNIIVTALVENKVNDLKRDTGKSGDTIYKLFNGLEEYDKSFDSVAAYISDFATENWDILKSIDLEKIKGLKSDGSDKEGVITITDKKGDIIYGNYKLGEYLEFDFTIDVKNGAVISKYDFKVLPKTITTSILKNSIILLDECTLLSPLAQSVISKLADENNILIFEAGDPVLPSWAQKVKGLNFGYDISEYGGFVVGNLAGIWRAENDSLQDTITKLYQTYTDIKSYTNSDGITKDVTLFDFSKPIDINDGDYDAVIRPNVEMIPITYTFDNKTSKYNFLGIVHDESIENEAIVNAQNVDGATRLVIVPLDSDIEDIKTSLSEISEFDPNKWEIIKANDVLGREVDYTLIYGFENGKLAIIDKGRAAFMALTRAKRGAIIHSSSTSFKALGFDQSVKNNRIREYQSEEKRDNIAQTRINIIKALSELLEKVEPLSKLISIPDTESNPDNNNDTDDSGQPPISILPSLISTTEKTEKDYNKEKAEEFTVWKEAFGGERPDMAQLEPWYIRIGLPKDIIKNPEIKTVQQLIDGGVEINTGNTTEDFIAFVILQNPNTNLPENIKKIFREVGIQRYSPESYNLKEALADFKAFRKYLEEHTGDFERFITYSEDDKLNWAYVKQNNNPSWTPHLYGGVSIMINGIRFNFTCGAFPQNTATTEQGEEIIGSKTIAKFLKEKGILYFAKEIKNSEVHDNGISSLNKSRDFNSRGQFGNDSLAFPHSKGLISMRLNPLLSGNAELFPESAANGDLKLGRIQYREYKATGNELVTAVPSQLKRYITITDGFIKFTGSNKNSQQQSMKAVLEYLRLDKTKDESSLQNILDLYNSNWILMKERGSQYLLLIFVSKTVASFRDSLEKGYAEVGENGVTKKYLKAYKHYVLLECLLKSKNNPELLSKFNDLRKSLKVDQETHTILESILKELETFLRDNLSNLPDFDSEGIKQLIDSYIKALKGWAVTYGITDKNKINWTKRAECFKGGITSNDVDSSSTPIGKLITQIDLKFKNYFYTNTSIKSLDDPSVKIERVYEPPTVLWDFGIFLELKPVTPVGTDPEISSTLDEEELFKTLKNQILNLLNPIRESFEGNASLKELYTNIESALNKSDLKSILEKSKFFSDDKIFGLELSVADEIINNKTILEILNDLKQICRNNELDVESLDNEKFLISDCFI